MDKCPNCGRRKLGRKPAMESIYNWSPDPPYNQEDFIGYKCRACGVEYDTAGNKKET